MAVNIALEKLRNADVVNCNFDDLYEWGYELLPPLRVYSDIKYFYKGISSTGNDYNIRNTIRDYISAMKLEGRFTEGEMDNDYYLQKLVKDYYRHWFYRDNIHLLFQDEAETAFVLMVGKAYKRQNNYLANFRRIMRVTAGKWRGREALKKPLRPGA
jgi:hypothetical protein